MTNPATSPSLTDAIDLGLILLDERATVRLWNDWLSKRSGIGPDKAVDQTLVGLFQDQIDPALLDRIADALANGRSHLMSSSLHPPPLPLYHPGTQPRTTRLSQSVIVRPVRHRPGLRHCLIQVTDVSAAVARERALRTQARDCQSKAAHLQAVLDGSLDGVLQLAADGTILSANRAAHRIFGGCMTEGTRIDDWLDRADGRSTTIDIAGAVGQRLERIGRRDTGALFPLEIAITGISHDIPTSFWAVIRDISERKGFEEHLAQKNRTLAQLAERLDRARRQAEISCLQAETANRMKSDFLTTMSHEIRTPLNSILGFAEIIEQRLFGDNPGLYTGYAGYILQSGRYLLDLVNDLLDLAKIEAGRMTIRREPMDVFHLCHACVSLMKGQAADHDVELVDKFTPNLPLLVADERLVRQMVLNLLSNAIKFTGPGGSVTLSAALRGDGGLSIVITDTGIGMSRTEITLALERFGQIENNAIRHLRGSGLGLPLVKALIEVHGGTLVLESEPRRGTRAELRFPPPLPAVVTPGASAP